MRNRFKRLTALALAAVLTLGPAASASQALGTEIHAGTTHLAEGVDLTRQYLWSAAYSDLRTERYMEYTPNNLVKPTVAYGDSILSKKSLTTLAQSMEAAGKRVVGGINGDYFVVSTGQPLGMVISDGVLRSSSSNHYALGFNADGTAFIGQPNLTVAATFRGTTYAVSGGLNKVRTETGGLVLYSSDYGPTTKHSEPGIDVILTPNTWQLGQRVNVDLAVMTSPNQQTQPIYPVYNPLTGMYEYIDLPGTAAGAEPPTEIRDTLVYTGVPTVGGRISCSVQQVLFSEKSIDIPAGSLVLSVNSKSDSWLVNALTSLQPGETIDLDFSSTDTRWKNAVTAVGGLYKMVTNGTVESGLDTAQAPRSAVGIRPDGSTVFYTVDGRQSGYSVGASMEQVAQRLIELGCTEAVCMDGGGSTTLGASLPGKEGFEILNQPSDGNERPISNALFLVADKTTPGFAQRLALLPGDAIVLAGSQAELSTLSVDQLGQPVQALSPAQVTYDFSGGAVSVGLLTAGSQTGTFPLTARSGGLSGTAQITVISKPDQITLYDETTGVKLPSLHVEPGGILYLNARPLYRNLALTCTDTDLTWSVSDGVGTVDPDGTFRAGQTNAAGTLTVTAGETSVSFPLTVSGHIHTVENFEGDFLHMVGTPTTQIEPETRPAYVRFGRQSGRLTYSTQESVASGTWMTLREGEKYLSMWVYGDGSGNTLIAPIQLSDGTTTDATVAVLNFTGWQQKTLPLPSGAAKILALKVAATGSAAQSVIWLDQVTSANQFFPDNSVPVISGRLVSIGTEEAPALQLEATITDNMGQDFITQDISVTYDGRDLPFTLSNAALTAQLPAQDGAAHRVTVTATDSSGNIGRGSWNIDAAQQTASVFSDISGHWAAPYANYLYAQNISTGVPSGNTLLFQPNKNISRGEFALMIARWMRLDLSLYSNIQLPFADTSSIPSWCLDAVKAMYALGVMQGSGSNGVYYANVSSNISRAEAMTMLGRIQPKGYATAELKFSDANRIPSWSTEYVSTMVGQGVVSGYNGALSPNAYITRCEIAKILHSLR